MLGASVPHRPGPRSCIDPGPSGRHKPPNAPVDVRRQRGRHLKPVTVLGVSAVYHDAAAALLRDGEIVTAAQEERFSRKKHDPRFPQHAIN